MNVLQAKVLIEYLNSINEVKFIHTQDNNNLIVFIGDYSEAELNSWKLKFKSPIQSKG